MIAHFLVEFVSSQEIKSSFHFKIDGDGFKEEEDLLFSLVNDRYEFSNIDRIRFRFETLIGLDIKELSEPRFPPKLLSFFSVLENLKISNLGISSISKKDFAGARALKKLHLSLNNIAHFDLDILTQAPLLDELDLSGNRISEMFNANEPLKLLKIVNLSNNPLKDIDSTWNKPGVEPHGIQINASELIIENCSLPVLYVSESMIHIHASRNSISRLLFDGSNFKLTALNLSQNSLSDLVGFDRNVFPDLQLLNLSHNRLWSIGAKSFLYMMTLRELDLSHNQLRTIHGDCLSVMPKLQILDLSMNNNRLQFDPNFPASSLSQLYTLDLRGNVMNDLDDEWFLPQNLRQIGIG